MTHVIRIATRKSPLALWQANDVADRLRALHPGLQTELVQLTTQGDRILDAPLSKVGGKGLFVKELEQAMLEGHADIAVHSMKDVPMELPEGLVLPVICEREDPRDALVSSRYRSIDALPPGAIVGTSSLRRAAQLRARRPDLVIRDCRGNVQTRLSKLNTSEYAAILLASAGLRRLGLADRIAALLPVQESLPACGQGAVGVECRGDDARVLALIAPLNHEATSFRVRAERALNRRLSGGCQVPIAGYAVLDGTQLQLEALVAAVNGERVLRASGTGAAIDAEDIGIRVAEELLAQGAGELLALVGNASDHGIAPR